MKIVSKEKLVLGVIDIIIGTAGVIMQLLKHRYLNLFIALFVLCFGLCLLLSSFKTNAQIQKKREEKRELYELMFGANKLDDNQ